MNPGDAFATLAGFSGNDLTATLSRIEQSLVGVKADNCSVVLHDHHAERNVLSAAGQVKRLVGQINVVIHALGIMLCLPHLLEPGEVIESASLGAGNTGKPFDLETNRRLAEFKFITWQGGPEAIRQNSVFKDFYCLCEYDSPKSKFLYLLGTEIPLRFLNGNRAIASVFSHNVWLLEGFKRKYPNYRVVSDYYLPRRDTVHVEDVTSMLSELLDGELV